MNSTGGRLHESEEWMTGRDHLTGLCGLHQFSDRVHTALQAMDPEHAAGMVMVFVNLHHFRRYNRRYGYEEGDVVLCRFAQSIQGNADIDFASRIAEDHFLFLTEQEVVERVLRELNTALQLIVRDGTISLRAGIYHIRPEDSVIAAGDKAKSAADSLRGKSVKDVFWHYYDHELEMAVERRSYIVENIDQAIRNGWIHVYYQPVMRTLTGKLCGMEALARWEDPVYGLMPPAFFIRVLEENLLIHKLDLCMVRLVCEDYQREKRAGRAFVPVSFNLSRLDFDLCDILGEVDKIVTEYEIPKDMLHIEITESMLSDNDLHVRRTMELFHEAGYQVWMDDFGSGYSTLNVLKDYNFDEIKIDMRFLSDSGERSRRIVTSVVDMSKKIGIQTLAEGVETKEQLDFLRKIGCEKIQGYFYGKPQPFDDGVRRLLQQPDGIENAAEGRYYDEIGRVNLIDERSVALAEFDGHTFRIPYINDEFWKVLGKIGVDSTLLLEELCNDPLFPVYNDIRDCAVKLHKGSGQRNTRFVMDGNYFLLTGSCVSELPDRKMLLIFISDMTENPVMNHELEMDAAIRNLYLTCDEVYLNNPDTGELHSLLSQSENPEEEESWRHKIDPKGYARDMIYSADQGRYLEFADKRTLYTRLQNSPKGFISAYFRTRQRNGEYHWKRHIFILTSKLGKREYVSAVQGVNEKALIANAKVILDGSQQMEQSAPGQEAGRSTLDPQAVRERAGWYAEQLPSDFCGPEVVLANENFVEPSDFWKDLLLDSDLKFAWKDTNRRYLGGSRAFLDYFGLSSISEILGKEDEKLGWHIAGNEYERREQLVLQEGRSFAMQPQRCMTGGTMRDVYTNKQPIYQKGKIVGILSWFVDSSEWKPVEEPAHESTDALAGCLNIRGIMQIGGKFRREYEVKKRDFLCCFLDLHEFLPFQTKYGQEAGCELLKTVASRLVSLVGETGAVGRIWLDNFVVFRQLDQGEDAAQFEEKIRTELGKIHRIGEAPVTIYVSIGSSPYSETEDIERCAVLARERMTGNLL